MLLAGNLAVMIITATKLTGQGDTWMRDSSIMIQDQQIEYLQTIADAKAQFMKVIFVLYT